MTYSLKFLGIFKHISDFIEPITLIWVSLERSFPPAEVKQSQRRCHRKGNKGESLSQAVMAGGESMG